MAKALLGLHTQKCHAPPPLPPPSRPLSPTCSASILELSAVKLTTSLWRMTASSKL